MCPKATNLPTGPKTEGQAAVGSSEKLAGHMSKWRPASAGAEQCRQNAECCYDQQKDPEPALAEYTHVRVHFSQLTKKLTHSRRSGT
jgi:hypothetical protein